MTNNIFDSNFINKCIGCSACAAVCNKNAITMLLNANGFYEPVLNTDACIGCGVCKKVCYKYDEKLSTSAEPIQCLSAINKNIEELKTASSGGVSIELMRECINQGYKVVGVAYDNEKKIAITKIASDFSKLEQFKGSKYFQSYTYNAFIEIAHDKTEQKYAIFGTPCQIYSYYKFAQLTNNREKFIFIDIFCHGCPSMNLWNKYLLMQEKKIGVESFDNIEFRSKAYGWHEYCFSFEENGKNHVSSKIGDPFHELFFDMQIMNEACYDCLYRSSIELTDIRLGDFWGWQYDVNIQGVSAVILNTDKGIELFENIKDKFCTKKFKFEDVTRAQSYGKKHIYDFKNRTSLMNELKSQKPLTEIIAMHTKKYSLRKRMFKFIKRSVGLLPTAFVYKMKKNIHKRGRDSGY